MQRALATNEPELDARQLADKQPFEGGLGPAQPASATHSISQPLPNRSCIDQTVRAGGSTLSRNSE
jgi:hypothetical protein